MKQIWQRIVDDVSDSVRGGGVILVFFGVVVGAGIVLAWPSQEPQPTAQEPAKNAQEPSIDDSKISRIEEQIEELDSEGRVISRTTRIIIYVNGVEAEG